ncbi:MAG: TPM domain-containing protein [Pseudanabaenaceae cyanobacterium bins.68]|nr:TPM domain-containing protein [Pseudanabaenaceae cyanobacterium bins.68]
MLTYSRFVKILALALILIASVVGFSPGASFGLSYSQLPDPRPQSWVYDGADILNEKAEAEINQIVQQLRPRAEVMVVTLEQARPEANDLATQLFNSWRIGTEVAQNGILFLTAKSDRRTVIRTGIGIARRLSDAKAKQIIDQEILPSFRQQNYEAGILSGLKAIVNSLQEQPFTFPGHITGISFGIALLLFSGSATAAIKLLYQPTAILPTYDPNLENTQLKTKSSLLHCLVWLASFALLYLSWTLLLPLQPVILILLAVASTFVSKLVTPLLLKQSPYQCQTCGAPINRLAQIDHLLTPAEKTAKALKSTGFEVLYCPKCSDSSQRAKVNLRKSRLKSPYVECEICEELTAKETVKVTVNATYDHPGELKHHKTCLCCDHETFWTTSIAQLVYTESSSFGGSYSTSDSDSSSGGSSDGGGASGDW